MEVYERINELIQYKKITKRKFAENLQNLNPRLKSTGETPNEKTIYKYLSGDINIPIELIGYIAEALDISEQELFETNFQTKIKLYKYITQNLDENQIITIKKIYLNAKLIDDVTLQYDKTKSFDANLLKQNKMQELFELLPYASDAMIEKFIEKLKEVKEVVNGEW
jgi:transcriptional regulator with XRE-family HTH domain